jgi:fibro-slime domain-containing protein
MRLRARTDFTELSRLGLCLGGALVFYQVSCSSGAGRASLGDPGPGGGDGSALPGSGGFRGVVDVTLGGMNAQGGANPGAGGSCEDAVECRVGCGNGRLDPKLSEVCDDGNGTSGDGCSADCKTVETDYVCPRPGEACVSRVRCGDGLLGGKETCDDGGTTDADGCSAACVLEPHWACSQPGAPCLPLCGDGVVAGNEQCDAPNPGNGCSASCTLEPGYVCEPSMIADAPPAPARCQLTECGDQLREGSEACDDGNVIDADGCSASCALEPDCSAGACLSRCGDGLKLSPEACDDANSRDGDGCSHDCQLEPGFRCEDTAAGAPPELNLRVIYRDFISFPSGGSTRHPDFEGNFAGADVAPRLVADALGNDGKPVMDGRCSDAQPATWTDAAACPYGQMLTTQASFDEWYNDTAGVNVAVPSTLLLPRLANGSYVYDSGGDGFYPIDNLGQTAAPIRESLAQADPVVNDGLQHNFGFTTELRYFFQYRGDETLTFSGDDDLWIFVNRRLALDVGGLHTRTERALDLGTAAARLGLTNGGVYEIALFQAERHSAGSNFKLTLTGFAPVSSRCAPECGDAVVVAGEQCDLGQAMNTGAYGTCTADCRRAPRCGDAIVQSNNEACDDGINLTTYGTDGNAGCAPGCVLSGFCGDGQLDGAFGEQCDLGNAGNLGGYGGCDAACQLGPRCGDGSIQPAFGETCDDGNTVSGDRCSHDCKSEIY